MRECVITSAARTAVGAYLGSLKTIEAEDLAAAVLKEAARRSGVALDVFDEVILGDVYGYTPNVARCAALLAGLPEAVPAYTVDRQCASSLQAVVSACHQIGAGEADVVLAGGVETMSRMLYYLDPATRYQPYRLGDKPVYDAFSHGVTIVQPKRLYPGVNMGLTAENVAERHGITRRQQDDFALDSIRKMVAAQRAGKFTDEIVPFEVATRRERFLFDTDEHVKPNTTAEDLAALKPVFKRDGTGTVTAGNASGMNDGASAVVVMAHEKADALGAKPLVRVVSMAASALDPRIMGLGPVGAVNKALHKAGLKLEDIDLFELNEAFAAQSLGVLIELGMQPGTPLYERVNVNGGAIAHGHALGSSGTRLMTTLIYEMKRRSARYGLVTLCIGGGQGLAMIVENVKDT